MKIDRNDFTARFYYGSTFSKFKLKFYDDAVVMQRWEDPADPDLKPECAETPMRYGGDRYVSFILNIPKPKAPVCTGTIIIMRISKNRYRAALDNGKTVAIETFTTVKELNLYCENFFA